MLKSISLYLKLAIRPIHVEPKHNLFERAYMDEFRRSIEMEQFFAHEFATAFDGLYADDPDCLQLPDTKREACANRLKATYSASNQLARNLEAVARTIAARKGLGMRRQIFFVLTGGWDHHQELVSTQASMLGEVDEALNFFWEALGEIGMREHVTTFTASDFGRTLRSNGRGTDHAWGGNYIVMSGSIKDGKIYGDYPTVSQLNIGAGLDVGSNGRLLPTHSVEQYVGEIARWFGVTDSSLADVFPNLNHFDNKTLGFLGM